MAKLGIFDVAVLLTSLQLMWTSSVQGYAVSPPDPMITAAPEYNFHIEARQDSFVPCTEWAFPDGSHPQCDQYSTCVSGTMGDMYGAGCGAADVTSWLFNTACLDYSAYLTTGYPNVVYCPQTEQFCLAYLYSSFGVEFTDYGCDTISGFIATAYWNASASPTAAVSSSAASSTTAFTSTTTTTPVATSPVATSPIAPTTSASSTQSAVPASGGSSSSGSSSNAATIGGAVGGAVGGLALVIGGILIWYFLRKKRNQQNPNQFHAPPTQQTPPQYHAPPEKMYNESTTSPMQSPPLGKSYC